MFKTNKIFFLIVVGVMLTAIFVFKPVPKTAKELSLKEISSYLNQIKKHKKRDPAQTVGEKVLVRLPDYQQTEVEELEYVFTQSKGLLEDELSILNRFIDVQLFRAGIKDLKTYFEYVNQFTVNGTTYVRYQQIVNHNFKDYTYSLQLKGAQVIAVIKNRRLVSLKSSAVKFSFSYAVFFKDGLEFDLSDREFRKLVGAFKINKLSRRLLRRYMNLFFNRVGKAFDFDRLLNRRVSEQKTTLNEAFGSIGRIELQKIFLELAKAKKLSLVRYGNTWMFQVDNFFELPIQFNIIVLSSNILKVRNLREIYHKVADVKGFESPLYPGGKKEEGTASAVRAEEQLQSVVAYILDKFGWNSYKGKSSSDIVSVHTQLESIDFKENAAWISSVQQILVGKDGESLKSLDSSLSILGHEYAHAIVEFSSGLIYEGESGALNEHFADMMGASIEATVNFKGEFQYTIGEDVLRDETRKQKIDLLEIIFNKFDYSDEQKIAFRLKSVGMRHLYAPELSYTTQYEHMVDVEKIYPEDCQPSYDNDNCGVHMSSGVLNRALALAISIEGLDKIIPLVFNTIVFRLGESSNFENYLVELYEECLETYTGSDTCNIILASFARVGLEHPLFSVQGRIDPRASTLVVEEIPVTGNATTPLLRLCGWVEEIDAQSYRIFDNQFNALAISRNFSVKTQGDYSDLKGTDCACVTGRLTQKNNYNSESQHIFLNVTDVEDRGNKCAEDVKIKDIRPQAKLDFQSLLGNKFKTVMTFCGWVSVNSRSKHVTIIDNRFDAALLVVDEDKDRAKEANYTLTRNPETFKEVYGYECACVEGELRDEVNKNGIVFNAFAEVKSVWKRPYEACMGLEWK